MKYSKLFSAKKTPQRAPIPGAGQVPNSAGGYAWAVDGWTQLDRFLILGSEDGTYYSGARKLSLDNAKNVIERIKEDGARVVSRIVEISMNGRAPKNDPAIFALALCSAYGNDETRAAALAVLPQVCRTGTHLFSFAAASDELRGWGRGLRKAVGRWYNEKPTDELEYQLVKYGQRDGWSNRDLLRLAHPIPRSEEHKVLYKWVVDGEQTGPLRLVSAVEALKSASVDEAVQLVREQRIPREALPTQLLTQAKIWEALLDDMPLTALIRNLGNMSKCGLLAAGSEAEAKVAERLNDAERLRKARVHPIAILAAMSTYAGGRGLRGDGQWEPSVKVVDALDGAFYKTFPFVEPANKRLLVGLDVSGSMAGMRVNGLALDCRQASGAMALVSLATEPFVAMVAFDTNSYPLALSSRQRLDDVVNTLAHTGGGGTNCALPIDYAIEKKLKVDGVVIYTDSETWQGNRHPAQAMGAYRKATGIAAKLVIVAMASNRFTIGATTDPLTLNVVGFDASVPDLIAQFLRN